MNYDIGEIVNFKGIIKVTNLTSLSMFTYLTKNKSYEILDIMKYGEGDIYYLICHNEGNTLWYPKDNFEHVSRREVMVKKYNLK